VKRLAIVAVLVVVAGGCDGGTNNASRDRCEAAFGAGNCVARHGTYVPRGVDTTTTGSPLDECKKSQDAAEAGSAVFYANSTPNHWPATIQDLTAMNPPALSLPNGVSATGTTVTGHGWTLTMTGHGTTAPNFTCSRNR